MPGILVMHQTPSIYEGLKINQSNKFGGFESASSVGQAMNEHREKRYELMLFDTRLLLGEKMASINAFKEAFNPLRKIWPTAKLVAMSERNAVRETVLAVKAGADAYLTYPLSQPEFDLVLQRINETHRRAAEIKYLRDQFWQEDTRDLVYTANPIMKKLYQNVKSVAPTRSSVLIQGETGVGKGVLARIIHRHSSRSEGPFISIHCGAIPDNLVESELFGHERGAFTGAVKRKLGRFEMANNGTIFLDEISTITPQVQVKLLKVLQEGAFHRVGGEVELQVDVRVIAATNESLIDLCNQGTFRRDLYYRINVFPISMPPLRERREDISRFVELFLSRLERNQMRNIQGVEPEVIEVLTAYEWPGNIRELENIIERAYILENKSKLTLDSLPAEIVENQSTLVPIDTSLTLAEARTAVIEKFERQYLEDLLQQNRGHIKKTSACAGIGVRQLHKLMSRYGLDKNKFK